MWGWKFNITFSFSCKTIVFLYYSVYVPFLMSKKILSCSLRFITFLILCTLRLIILLLRFLFDLTILYLTPNMSCFGSVFDVNVSYIVNDNFNYFKSFLIFSNNSVYVDVHVNGDNYLNRKFCGHKFQSKLESNINNVKLEILFFFFFFLKHNCD